MSPQDTFTTVLAALHEAALDDTLWPRASALLDEACGATGNAVVVAEGCGDEARVSFGSLYYRGEPGQDILQEYLEHYYPRDERLPRLRQLPDGQLTRVTELYTPEELRTSPAYNEALLRAGAQNALNVRLDGPGGTRIVWSIADPAKPGDWGPDQTSMIERLLPHVRQFVEVRQVLAQAQARNASLTGLLDNDRVGVVQLDRDGHILEMNDRALKIVQRDDGLLEQNGTLEAWLPADNNRLQRILAAALSPLAGQAAAGSMTVRRMGDARKLMVAVNPVAAPPFDFGARRVAALVLLKEAGGRLRLDAGLVADLLGLSAAESQVAVMLSEGLTPPEIATATGRQTATVNTLMQRAYRKLGVSRQVDLVRLTLMMADAPALQP